MAARALYSYTSLHDNEIRILHLLPGEFGTPLHAMLEHIPLSDADEAGYETVSYAWGSRLQPHKIGIDDGTYLEVTVSLYEALQQFRHLDESRALWADALCINQNDTLERSAQVTIMGDIFRTSSKVLVWLGPAEKDDELAFAAMKAFSLVPEDYRTGDKSHYNIVEDNFKIFAEIRYYKKLGSSILAFGRLLDRPWFSRLWVIEEVAFGRAIRLYSGSRSLSWEKFLGCVYQLRDLRETVLADDSNFRELSFNWLDLTGQTLALIESRRRAEETLFNTTGFLTAMHTFSHKRCQEPHDRIYSVRRFLGLQKVDALYPDYNLNPDEIYRRVTEQCLMTAQMSSNATPYAALILGLVGTEVPDTQHGAQRPSWVPNFNNLSDRSRCKHDRYRLAHLAQFHWTGTSFPNIYFPAENQEHLSIGGHIFGTVASVCAPSKYPFTYRYHKQLTASMMEVLNAGLVDWVYICARYIPGIGRMREVLSCDDPHVGQAPPFYDKWNTTTLKRRDRGTRT